MHKKYYFAGFFILIGLFIGFLFLFSVNEVGLENQSPMPLISIMYVVITLISIGLSFIIFGGSKADE
ncbi:MAG: hypothetical protein COA79_04755 [Planctomycetota bacterium]|nr:MAG: hypothetical protein COA79_04755 [Planctomycetota bacterium]